MELKVNNWKVKVISDLSQRVLFLVLSGWSYLPRLACDRGRGTPRSWHQILFSGDGDILGQRPIVAWVLFWWQGEWSRHYRQSRLLFVNGVIEHFVSDLLHEHDSVVRVFFICDTDLQDNGGPFFGHVGECVYFPVLENVYDAWTIP